MGAAIQRRPEGLYASFIRSSAVTSQQGSLSSLEQTPRPACLTLTLTCPFSQPSGLHLSSCIACNGFPLLSSVTFQALHCSISRGFQKLLVSCYHPWAGKIRHAIETMHLEGSGQEDWKAASRVTKMGGSGFHRAAWVTVFTPGVQNPRPPQ